MRWEGKGECGGKGPGEVGNEWSIFAFGPILPPFFGVEWPHCDHKTGSNFFGNPPQKVRYYLPSNSHLHS
jgi:hypothetical protein